MIPKFRAWDKKNRTMYEVKSIIYTVKKVIGINRAVIHIEKMLDFDDIELMQSIGLFDKNGVEIFEGDVVQRSLQSGAILFGTVEFTKGLFLVDGIETISDEYIVIGNIWEKPKLLEERR